MVELSQSLKKKFEKENRQVLHRCKCKCCGKFEKIVISNFVALNTIYAITYCKKCNKFHAHIGGCSIDINGEGSYHYSETEIKFNSKEWKIIVKQIYNGSIII